VKVGESWVRGGGGVVCGFGGGGLGLGGFFFGGLGGCGGWGGVGFLVGGGGGGGCWGGVCGFFGGFFGGCGLGVLFGVWFVCWGFWVVLLLGVLWGGCLLVGFFCGLVLFVGGGCCFCLGGGGGGVFVGVLFLVLGLFVGGWFSGVRTLDRRQRVHPEVIKRGLHQSNNFTVAGCV